MKTREIPHYEAVLTEVQLERLRALADTFDQLRISWDKIPDGHERVWERSVTQEGVYGYADGVQDYSVWYVPGFSPFDRPVAPPLFVSRMCSGAIEDIGPLVGWIHSENRTHIGQPVFVGDTLEFRAKVTQKFIKRDRRWIEITVNVVNKATRELVLTDVRTFAEPGNAENGGVQS